MAALYLLLIVKRKYKQLVLITVVLLTAVYFSPVKARFMDEEYTVRIANYYLYSAIIRDYPITGIGFGMQTYQDPKLNIDSYNDYVHLRR